MMEEQGEEEQDEMPIRSRRNLKGLEVKQEPYLDDGIEEVIELDELEEDESEEPKKEIKAD